MQVGKSRGLGFYSYSTHTLYSYSTQVGKISANPIFTHFYESQDKPRPLRIFYEDDEMLVIPNVKTHSTKAEGSAAAMSYVHILTVPKRRIYNAVNLTHADIPLCRRMMQKTMEILTTDPVREFYIHERDLAPSAFNPQCLEFYVHLHPNQSVGQLHIHGCLTNLWTANGDLLQYKNTKLVHVLEVLQEEHDLNSDGAITHLEGAVARGSTDRKQQGGKQEGKEGGGQGGESTNQDNLRQQRLNEELFNAATMDNAALIKRLLAEGAAVDGYCNTMGSSALHHACWNGYAGCVNILLDGDASVERKTKDGKMPIDLAKLAGRQALVKRLEERMKELAERRPRVMTAGVDAEVFNAVTMNDTGLVRNLLARGGNPDGYCNTNGSTALHHACWNGYVGCAIALLDAGASRQRKTHDKKEPFDMARKGKRLILLEYLQSAALPHPARAAHNRASGLFGNGAEMYVLAHSQELNAALFTAAVLNDVKMVSQLLEQGADPDSARDEESGFTALHHCCHNGYIQCCSVLLQGGADPTATAAFKNSDGSEGTNGYEEKPSSLAQGAKFCDRGNHQFPCRAGDGERATSMPYDYGNCTVCGVAPKLNEWGGLEQDGGARGAAACMLDEYSSVCVGRTLGNDGVGDGSGGGDQQSFHTTVSLAQSHPRIVRMLSDAIEAQSNATSSPQQRPTFSGEAPYTALVVGQLVWSVNLAFVDGTRLRHAPSPANGPTAFNGIFVVNDEKLVVQEVMALAGKLDPLADFVRIGRIPQPGASPTDLSASGWIRRTNLVTQPRVCGRPLGSATATGIPGPLDQVDAGVAAAVTTGGTPGQTQRSPATVVASAQRLNVLQSNRTASVIRYIRSSPAQRHPVALGWIIEFRCRLEDMFSLRQYWFAGLLLALDNAVEKNASPQVLNCRTPFGGRRCFR
jgi:ankyrin repeat protein